MKSNRALAALIVLLAGAFFQQAHSQTSGILLTIEKHAVLTRLGTVVISIHITCGPFAGTEEFQEGHAGGGQDRTGAAAETGIDGTVICDGVERTHTAQLASLTDAAFKRGPASVSASFTVCMLVGDEQMCFSGATSRGVIIRGGRLR